MQTTRDITRIERRLAEVDSLDQAIASLQEELRGRLEGLHEALAHLKDASLQQSEGWSFPEEGMEANLEPAAAIPEHESQETEDSEPERSKITPVAPGRSTLQGNLEAVERIAQEMAAEDDEDEEEIPSTPFTTAREILRQRRRKATPTHRARPEVNREEPDESADPGLLGGDQKQLEGYSRGGKPVSIMISNGLSDSDPVSGWVLERSQTSLRILVDEELPVGAVYSIRPTRDHPNVQWLPISVKSCHVERNSFMVICQFVERPPWTALALF